MRTTFVLATALALVAAGCKRRPLGGDGGAGGGSGSAASRNPARVLATGELMPLSLAVDATHVYWGTGEGGLVRRVAKTGGTPETIFSEIKGRVLALAVDDTHAYFGILDLGLGASLLRVPKGGGAMERVCEPYWVQKVFLDGDDVWLYTREAIVRRKKAGGSCDAVWTGYDITSAAIDATHVYWIDRGTLRRGPRARAPKQAAEQLAVGLGNEAKLAIDDTHVYVYADEIFTYVRLPKTGGPIEVLAHEVGNDFALAPDRLLLPDFDRAITVVGKGGGTFVELTDPVGKEGSVPEQTVVAVDGDTLWAATSSSTPPGGIVHIDLTSDQAAAETEKRLAAMPPTTYHGRILQLSVRPPGVALNPQRPERHRLGFVAFEQGTLTPAAEGKHSLDFTQRYDDDFLDALRAGRAPIVVEAPTSAHAAAAIAYVTAKLPGARFVTRLRSVNKSAELSLALDALVAALTPPP